ncbi:MAG: hypothetical protein KDD46_06170, partial [Bdellovibrionales bacterium]|nr:hypothetical protein [Bdellovibrionales bacterium]
MMNRFLTIPMRLFACTFVLVFLTHCGFLKERSNETRAFLDKPDSFDQVKLKSSTPAKDTPEKSTQENTSAKAFEEKHQATEKLGAVLVFSSKQKPEFQYFTKFLTEKKEIDPLVGPNNEKLNLTDLENMDENLPLPSGSDLGSYIFHRDAKLRGVENKLYTLPTDKLSEFGVDEQAWESAWNKIKSNCSSDMQAALVRSEFDFDVNDVSFQDFIVDEDYIVRKDDKLIFTNLAGIVQRKLLEAFKPNLQQVQGTLDGQFAFCNSDTPQIWRYDGNHFVPSIEVQNTGTNPRSIFETTVTRQFLDRIALQDNQKLSDLKLGDDYSLFSREKYRHHEELQIPNMNDVFVAIQKAGTERPKKVETSNSESSEAVTATEAEVQSPSPEADHNEIQKWILAQPKRQTKPLEDSEIEVRKETLQEHQPVVVSRGNSQMYDELKGQLGSQVLVTKDGHLTNNPFYSIIPKRLSSIFYDGPDNYLSDDSGHVVFKEVNGVTPNGKPQKETLRYTPFSRMWNDDGFKNGPTFNDAFVYNEACKGYPLVRDTTFSASLVKPKEFSQRTYLTIDGHSKSFKEVVGD